MDLVPDTQEAVRALLAETKIGARGTLAVGEAKGKGSEILGSARAILAFLSRRIPLLK